MESEEPSDDQSYVNDQTEAQEDVEIHTPLVRLLANMPCARAIEKCSRTHEFAGIVRISSGVTNDRQTSCREPQAQDAQATVDDDPGQVAVDHCSEDTQRRLGGAKPKYHKHDNTPYSGLPIWRMDEVVGRWREGEESTQL